MLIGPALDVGMGYSVIPPDVVIRPILLTSASVNHSAPSEPVVMPSGLLGAVGRGYRVKLTDCAYEVAGIANNRNTARHKDSAVALRARCNGTAVAVACATNREGRCIVIERSPQVLRRSLHSWYEHHVPRVS